MSNQDPQKARTSRNVAIATALIAFAALTFLVTIVKLQGLIS